MGSEYHTKEVTNKIKLKNRKINKIIKKYLTEFIKLIKINQNPNSINNLTN